MMIYLMVNDKNNNVISNLLWLCCEAVSMNPFIKKYLYLSTADYHIINGMKKRLNPSMFVSEIQK